MDVTSYHYQAYSINGKVNTGQINAESEKEVIAVLKSRQLFPIKIHPATQRTVSGESTEKLKHGELIEFTQGLTTLMKSKIPIDKALVLLSELSGKETTRQIIETLRRDVKEGKTLAQAMEKKPETFDKMYISIIRAGEEGGILDELLPSLNNFLISSAETRKQLLSAMIYPAVLLAVGILSIILMLAFVVPQFATLFEDAGSAIPASAKFLLALSDFIQNFGWILLLLPFVLFAVWKKMSNDETIQINKDKLLLKIPLLGNLLLQKEGMMFCQTLGALLLAGVPLFKALGITRGVIKNRVIYQQLDLVKGEVTSGLSLGKAIAKHTQFPILIPKLISVGEETGRTAEMLAQLAETFDKSVKDSMSRLVALAEPLLILILGFMVGGIVITMLSAVFSLNDMGI